MILIFLGGFLGGILRGLTGFLKQQFSHKDIKFSWSYFLETTLFSGIIGLVSAAAIKEAGIIPPSGSFGPAFAVIAGYAGGDFLENIYKIIAKKSSLSN